MQIYRYTDGTGPAKQVTHNAQVYPASYLVQRAAETEAAWIERIAAIGVIPVSSIPWTGDPNTQDKGEAVETLTDGWLVISYPNTRDKTPYYNKATREVMYVADGQTVPDKYTAQEPTYGIYSTWDDDAGQWTAALDRLRMAKQAQITDGANDILASQATEYGDWEIATWDQQYSEALSWQADAEADVPLLTAIAAARDMTVAELASRVVTNRAAWVSLSGNIVGQRLAYQDVLDAATTYDELTAIEVTYGI